MLPYLPTDDLLWRQLKSIPAFRALLRAVESRFYHAVELPAPILDLGCGDGHFAQMTFTQPLDAGIDPWWGPLQKARRSGQYLTLAQAMGDRLPFPDHTFASAISNSVLEHIPDIQPVLNDLSRVMQPGGRLVITMPSHHFTQNLGGAAFLARLGLPGMADRYRHFFNYISRHAHTDTAEVWAERLAQAGFQVERWQYYFSTAALRALEWGHVQGLPSAILHALTGHWLVAPWESSLSRTEQWVRPFFDEEAAADGAYVLFVARKVADGPVPLHLPAAHPFTLAELQTATATAVPVPPPPEPPPLENTAPEPVPDQPQPTPAAASPLVTPWLINRGLALLALLFATLGQFRLGSTPEAPAPGLRWFGWSALALLLLLWQRWGTPLPTWRWPRQADYRASRLLILPALGLSLLAYRQGNVAFHPTLALGLLVMGALLAVYAFWPVGPPALVLLRPDRLDWLAMGALGLGAWLLRMVALQRIPFILNGTEASMGLEAKLVLEGVIRSPFATGWLTNPTLPAFIMAVPINWFGASVGTLRVLSPLMGALTVGLTYWYGRRLWGRLVGLLAGLLLAGSHFHLHYSRLGMTNSWDALLALLVLGRLVLAWESEAGTAVSRKLWLAVGTAVGLSAYLYTTSHLLPLIIATLLLLVLLTDRHALRRHTADLLAAGWLALVIALPQLLYYQANPSIFMERANALGILDGQTGWLAQEAARLGVSRAEVWWPQVWSAVLAFNGRPDRSPVYRSAASLLTFGPALLFAMGLILAGWQWRQMRYRVLLVWVGLTVLFAGVLLLEPPQSHRLVMVTPALALLAGLALAELGGWLAAPDNRYTWGVLVGVALLLGVNDGVYYFGRYPQENHFADRNTEVAHEIGTYLNSLDASWMAYFYGPPTMYVDFPTILFLATEFQRDSNLFNVSPPPDAALPPVQSAAPAAQITFLFLPERYAELTQVQQAYPGGQLRRVAGEYADPLFYIYEWK